LNINSWFCTKKINSWFSHFTNYSI